MKRDLSPEDIQAIERLHAERAAWAAKLAAPKAKRAPVSWQTLPPHLRVARHASARPSIVPRGFLARLTFAFWSWC